MQPLVDIRANLMSVHAAHATGDSAAHQSGHPDLAPCPDNPPPVAAAGILEPVDAPKLIDLVEMILKDRPRLERIIRDPALAAELVPRFLAVSLLGFTLFGVVLALALVTVGMLTAIASARAGATPLPSIPPLVFLVMPVGELVTFTVLFTAAVVLRKRSPWHKRLMLLASIALLAPAMARLPFGFVQSGGPPAFFGLTDLVILACIAFDTVKNRRVHPAFIAGFVVVVVGQLGRLLVSRTPEWMTFAKWLVG